METTNWDTADIFQNECPHTFNSLQHLVMSMAKVFNNRGKKSIFGKDKGLAAYKSFKEPRWPLQNAPPVAGSKCPTPATDFSVLMLRGKVHTISFFILFFGSVLG